ncbi:MAG: type VI secretion system contractile sheath small subunit [Chitinophagaceae bacterium]|nr:type VI secretion system contractile sheath small subunit [Chitinophagaceae bacterium]
MAVEKYSIGGTMQETDASEAFADIPQNRVLLAEKLTVNAPSKPVIEEDLTNVEQVFERFKPKVDVNFETSDGVPRKETLAFKNLGDFGVKGITAQSNFLGELTLQREEFRKIIKQLKSNKLLHKALKKEETRQHLINSLNALIKELETK